MTEKVYLYGKNPLKEAILAKKRDGVQRIERLYVTKKSEADAEMMSLIQSNNLAYDVVTKEEIESMVGRESVNQGVCALLYTSALYTDLDTVLEKSKEKKGNSLFILLDKLEDPHNVGAIIRSAVAFGADAILMPEYEQAQISGSVIKSASGMNFAIPIVRIGNINTTLKQLQEKRFWVYGLTGEGDTKLEKVTFDSDAVIVIGSEGEGIRKKTLEYCDFRLSINTSALCESLNASNATAVTLYEWNKQQNA